MPLQWEKPEGLLFVRHCGEHSVTVVDRTFSQSFLLLPDAAHDSWPVDDIDQLNSDHAQACLELDPELVLLGTGRQQRFPAPQWLSLFLSKGIGCEVMDNAAAARTFNVLSQEGRRVLAAFIIEPTD